MIRVIIIISSLFLFQTGRLQAQQAVANPSQTPDSLAARQARFLTQKLSLNKQQEQEVLTATKQLHQNLIDFRNKPAKSGAQRSQEVEKIQKAFESALKKSLTPSQWSAYEKEVAAQRSTFLQHANQKKIMVKELPKQ